MQSTQSPTCKPGANTVPDHSNKGQPELQSLILKVVLNVVFLSLNYARNSEGCVSLLTAVVAHLYATLATCTGKPRGHRSLPILKASPASPKPGWLLQRPRPDNHSNTSRHECCGISIVVSNRLQRKKECADPKSCYGRGCHQGGFVPTDQVPIAGLQVSHNSSCH